MENERKVSPPKKTHTRRRKPPAIVTVVSPAPRAALCQKASLGNPALSALRSEEAKHLWKVRKSDFFLWLLATMGVLFLGVLNGLSDGVGFLEF